MARTTSIALQEGLNQIRFTLQTAMPINKALASTSFTFGDNIKSSTMSAIYYDEGDGWQGSLNILSQL